jgi:hypothetical protein
MIKQCILSLLCLLWAGQTVLAGELRERVYLQTDKQFYLSGELVWMKFIATDLDQRLSDVSKVGYVELLDSASAVVQARLVLEKGVGDGCLQLPSTLPTGNYRLVAYTRYMRNEGEEVFFEKPLAVVNTFVTNETLLTDTLLPAYSFTRREGPVSVSPDRMTYDTRSGGAIRINGLPPDLQTLSVSIAGIDLYKPSARSGIVDWKQSMPTTGSSPADRKFLAEKISPSPASTWTKRKICGWELPVTDFTVYRETKRFPNLSQEVISRVFTKIRLKNYGSVPGKKDSTG